MNVGCNLPPPEIGIAASNSSCFGIFIFNLIYFQRGCGQQLFYLFLSKHHTPFEVFILFIGWVCLVDQKDYRANKWKSVSNPKSSNSNNNETVLEIEKK